MEPTEQIEARSFPFRRAETVHQMMPINDAPRRRPPDRVELTARFLRGDLVDRVRGEILSGTYDNEGRIAGAADAMMRKVFGR